MYPRDSIINRPQYPHQGWPLSALGWHEKNRSMPADDCAPVSRGTPIRSLRGSILYGRCSSCAGEIPKWISLTQNRQSPSPVPVGPGVVGQTRGESRATPGGGHPSIGRGNPGFSPTPVRCLARRPEKDCRYGRREVSGSGRRSAGGAPLFGPREGVSFSGD